MALFVMLTRLTDHGAKTLKEKPERMLEVDGQLSEMGVEVLHQYAVLGRYDFVNIVEAPDTATVMRAALELAARGSIRLETMPALSAEDLIGTLRS
ncbi:GYD domain-containing protein [bacterium]|nr:GYD domain-containing protein [bacterium]